jgi:choline-sulfatase
VHSPADPDQLFDLATDPLERRNLAESPAHAGLLAELRAEVAARWDLTALDRAVRESQQRRRAVVLALETGASSAWDYAPPYDASRRYIRNHTDLGALELMARYPPLPRRQVVPPDPPAPPD